MKLPRKHRCKSLCLFLSILALLFSGCSASSPSPTEVLSRLCSAEAHLPAGNVYVLSDATEEQHPLSDALLSAAFGGGSYPVAMDGVEDAAVFFSLRDLCEFDLFLCKNAEAANAIEQLCLARLDLLRRLWREDPQALSRLDNAEVLRHGRWVLLSVSSDPATVRRTFLRAI